MFRKNIMRCSNTSIKGKSLPEGEMLETKIRRILHNKEPLTDGVNTIYQDRKEGVNPDYDIRTDRWDVAIEAMDVVSKSKIAKRNYVQNSTDDVSKQKDMKGDVADSQSTQGTEPGNPAA